MTQDILPGSDRNNPAKPGSETPIKAEIVEHIPVKNPDAAPATPNAQPLNGVAADTKAADSDEGDNELNQILKDVTKTVKKTAEAVVGHPATTKQPQESSGNPNKAYFTKVVVATAAIATAAVLIILAIKTYDNY